MSPQHSCVIVCVLSGETLLQLQTAHTHKQTQTHIFGLQIETQAPTHRATLWVWKIGPDGMALMLTRISELCG